MASEQDEHPLIWNDPGWRREALVWTQQAIDGIGRRITGEIEQPHVRPWATAFSVPTSDRTVWFKASIPELRHEVATLELLGVRSPRAVPVLLASDRDRGWMLIEDAGMRLGELEPPQLERWEEIVGLYAQLQLDAAPDADALAAAGVPDRRGAFLAEQLAALLEDERVLKPQTDTALADDEIELLRRTAVARVAADSERLESLGVPASIQHDDLHEANVFVADGSFRIIDWGDACVAHPLLSIDLTLRVVADRFGLRPDAPELERIRAAYLEPFTAIRSRDELVAANAAVARAAAACGTIKWYEVFCAIPEWTRSPYYETIPVKLRRLLSLCG